MSLDELKKNLACISNVRDLDKFSTTLPELERLYIDLSQKITTLRLEEEKRKFEELKAKESVNDQEILDHANSLILLLRDRKTHIDLSSLAHEISKGRQMSSGIYTYGSFPDNHSQGSYQNPRDIQYVNNSIAL